MNLIITGLVETPNENLESVIGDMLGKISVPLDTSFFKANRIGKTSESRPNRRVIVKFTREDDKNLVLSRKCNLRNVGNGSFEKVYIQEDMTPQQREALTQMYREADSKNEKENLEQRKWIVAGRRTQPFLKLVPVRAKPTNQ